MAALLEGQKQPRVLAFFRASFNDVRIVSLACILGVMSLALAGCGGDDQTDYSTQNRDEFFAACTAPLSDSTLVTRICGCVFDTAQKELAYDRFVEIENELLLDPQAQLAPELAAIMADCIAEEADL